MSIIPFDLLTNSVTNLLTTTDSCFSTIFTAAGLLDRSVKSHFKCCTGAHAWCKDPERISSIILLILISVGVKARVGTKSPIVLPGPPKKLSNAVNMIEGSITIRERPVKGCNVTVFNAIGACNPEIYSS